jgi:hypothetical protein
LGAGEMTFTHTHSKFYATSRAIRTVKYRTGLS